MRDRKTFGELLFKTAFCFMACDGHIDDREIEEIQKLTRETKYFRGVDVSAELVRLVDRVKSEGRQIFKNFIDEVAAGDLDVVQELLLLEVALRVVYIDLRIDGNEIRFLRLLRSKLSVPTEVIVQRFGTVDLLLDGGRPSRDVRAMRSDPDSVLDGISNEQFKVLEIKLEGLDGV